MAPTRVDNAALFAVLSSLADNKQAIGRRYAYWCNGAPALEAAVAAAAMAQDELGHARTLYPLLEDFVQAEADPGQVEPMTRTLHYHLAFLDRDFQGWSDFVATNFLLDNALTTFFEAAQNSSYEPLRQRARKIVQEERIHALHAYGWVRRLARAGGAVRSTLVASLERLDRKSTRLNSSHTVISYAVFCLKKKKTCERQLVQMQIQHQHQRVQR